VSGYKLHKNDSKPYILLIKVKEKKRDEEEKIPCNYLLRYEYPIVKD
jgi:hypothetical protein